MSEATYDKIRSMIYRRQLNPGDRLVERDLAAQFGISRIPLRESLARLEGEGLIRSQFKSGTFVEDFSPADALEIYSMRLLLEPTATRLATLRGGSRLLTTLQRLREQMTAEQSKQNFHKVDDLDYRFHLTIVQASAHKRLIRAYKGCHIRVLGLNEEYRELLQLPFDSTAAEHSRIMSAIEAGRPDIAEQAATDHVRNAMTRREDVLKVRFENLPVT
jgi:DNA-binding GntR family transcriptional regulator